MENNANVAVAPADAPAVAQPQIMGGQFFVKTLSGKSITMSLNPDMLVRDVKQKVFEVEQIPIEQQRLVYQGKQLEDNMQLKNYDIADNACLHLVLRLRGGM